MGITIHYSFIRHNDPEPLMQRISEQAAKLGMRIQHRSVNHLVIDPHPESEWIDLHWRKWKTIRQQVLEDAQDDVGELKLVENIVETYCPKLVYDEDWVCTGFTKTQFAGVDCHCAVAELLRQVAGYCRVSKVSDEAGCYELGKEGRDKAKRSFDEMNTMLSEFTARLKKEFGVDNVICGQDLFRR
jgi:hypothetical protein